ncbi:hypothetical protein AOLI_G00143900 [Acnodon oligacanthus]
MCVWGKSRDAKRDQPAGGDRALFMFGFSLSALSSFCLLLLLISSALFFAMSSEGKYSSVDFEIFGDVQAVLRAQRGSVFLRNVTSPSRSWMHV